jgi:pimeloyl-ACP methyl ester carboxylesterase
LRRQYLDSEYGQLHLRVARAAGASRSRRPVVCFHLSPVSGAVYEALLGELAHDRDAYAPDTPGYGDSDGPAEPPEIADYARVMAQMLDALGLTDVDCVGFHTGSKIAVELARQLPSTVRHLVLISAPVYTDSELAAMRASYAPFTPREDGGHLLEYWRELVRWRGPGQTPQQLTRYFADHIRGGDRRHFGHRAAFNYRYESALPQLRQPILVLNNRDDLREYTRRVQPWLADGTVIERDDWGHGFLDLHTREFAQLLREFFDRSR